MEEKSEKNIIESLHCILETDISLYSNYTSIKIFKNA